MWCCIKYNVYVMALGRKEQSVILKKKKIVQEIVHCSGVVFDLNAVQMQWRDAVFLWL